MTRLLNILKVLCPCLTPSVATTKEAMLTNRFSQKQQKWLLTPLSSLGASLWIFRK
uniref:Uncharacterized protein n=1 Tax=uncultured marine virus TaxID=186617 RepID=A0A0F7L3U0_9VIRU|nr:hypothetical protein [uncultured marine virus]